ncbi:MAG: peptide chain release factor N(5)-glutamine methyltransferase [Oscillospiraceae bacterium]|nr:peptide chain release factor N(5)-glutamine methyltransferase [Oscillospiraceae bacterium]
MKTYNEIYLEARKKLRMGGISAHDLEARLIVSHASGKTKEEYLAASRLYVTEGATVKAVNEMLERRMGGEPLAYIVGEWEFYGLPIVVNRSVLIPRVDTELLADVAISILKKRGGQARLLDLCTGTGCVGLAVAANIPNCRVVLADVSEPALAASRLNMLNNNLGRQAIAIEADVMEQPPKLLGTFDIIVSNPPYIPTSDLKLLEPSVRDYEPHLALDGGPDGLTYIRAIIDSWSVLLRPGGAMAIECGIGQAQQVAAIMGEQEYKNIEVHTDTGGIERIVSGKIKG